MKLASYLALMALPSFAAQQTWTGRISDTICAARGHNSMSSNGRPVNPQICTIACVNAGAKFAFVSDGTVFEIANQNLSSLSRYAGANVIVTGSLADDGKTITVLKVSARK